MNCQKGKMNREIEKIEKYYIEFGPMILRRCRFLLKDESRAYDAMHDIFVKLLSSPIKFNNSSSYLYRMATNHCLNLIKKSSRFSDFAEVPEVVDNYDLEERVLNSIEIDDFFKRLPKSSRVIAELRYVSKLKLDDIAEAVGMSQSGVRKRLRGLKELSEREIK